MSYLHLLRRAQARTARVFRGALVVALLAVNFGNAAFVSTAHAATTDLTGVTYIAAGSFHSLGLKSDGTVLGWGTDSSGQLGDNNNDPKFLPVQAVGLGAGSGVIAVAAGNQFSLALKSDGTVLGWGQNSNGQLGDGTTTQRNTPVQVSGLGSGSGVIAIAAGNTHSFALKSDGTVLAWGANSNGQLGDGTTTQRTSPVQVSGLGSGSGVIAISSSSFASSSLALKSDGTVLAWGLNSTGQLGDGTTTQRTSPVQVSGLGSGSGVTAISGGAFHSLALMSDGTLLAWGANSSGQVGDGTTTQRTSPVQVSGLGSGSGVTAVKAGRDFNLALKSDGTVLAWGINGDGMLGIGSLTESVTPVQVSGLGVGSGVTAIAAGRDHSLALKSDGTVLAWGINSFGMLGDGTAQAIATPVQVSGLGAGSGVIATAAGQTQSLALTSDGTVLAWGQNSSGQLGDGTTTQRTSPVQVSGLGTGSGVVAVAGGQFHSLALMSDGTVLAWGLNSNGQLGDGTTTQRTSPVQVSGLGAGSGVIAVASAVSANFSLALKSDGTVLAWGQNANGQLGDGTTTQRTSPVQVSGLGAGSGVIAIAAGNTHSLALKSDGTVLAWGLNGNGQIGDGTTTQRTSPVQVSGLGAGSGVTALRGENFVSLALKSDGTVLAWGLNASGQLGDGTVTQRTSPVQVSGLGSGSGVTAISSGGSFSVALKSDGTVFGWATNSGGFVGQGTFTAPILVPVQVHGPGDVGFLSGISGVSTGNSHVLALKSDGTLLAWGLNSNGQLGDGTVYTKSLTPSNVLIAVPDITAGNISVSGGTGSGGSFKRTDTVTAEWDNSAGGDDNTDLTAAPTADLSDWGGSATATMTDTTACGGAAGDDVFEACFTVVDSIVAASAHVSVTATNANGSTTTEVDTGLAINSDTNHTSSEDLSITLAQPNGGEALAGGSQYSIGWSTTGTLLTSVRISLSTDGGGEYPTVIAAHAAGTSYAWTVPTTATSTARIRVEGLLDNGTVAASDRSEANFTISASSSGGSGGGGGGGSTPPPASPPPATGTANDYSPATVTAIATSINADLGLDGLTPPAVAYCVSGSLIKLPSDGDASTQADAAVYYCGKDGKRYVFPSQKIFLTWFADFSSVTVIDAATMANIPIGGNVTYRPGVRMVKIQTDPKVYAVDRAGLLHWVTTEAVAIRLYGAGWNTMIDDVSDAFFVNYTVGDPITSVQ